MNFIFFLFSKFRAYTEKYYYTLWNMDVLFLFSFLIFTERLYFDNMMLTMCSAGIYRHIVKVFDINL